MFLISYYMKSSFGSQIASHKPNWSIPFMAKTSCASGASVAFMVAMAERKAKLGGIVERSSNAEAMSNTETLGSWRLDFGMIWNLLLWFGVGEGDRKTMLDG